MNPANELIPREITIDRCDKQAPKTGQWRLLLTRSSSATASTCGDHRNWSIGTTRSTR